MIENNLPVFSNQVSTTNEFSGHTTSMIFTARPFQWYFQQDMSDMSLFFFLLVTEQTLPKMSPFSHPPKQETRKTTGQSKWTWKIRRENTPSWTFTSSVQPQTCLKPSKTNLVGGFKYLFLTLTCKNNPIWLIFFRWVDSTNQKSRHHFNLMLSPEGLARVELRFQISATNTEGSGSNDPNTEAKLEAGYLAGVNAWQHHGTESVNKVR